MRRHLTAPVNVARISVATSGTDFIAPEADFAALIRAAGLSRIDQTCLGRSGFPLTDEQSLIVSVLRRHRRRPTDQTAVLVALA